MTDQSKVSLAMHIVLLRKKEKKERKTFSFSSADIVDY